MKPESPRLVDVHSHGRDAVTALRVVNSDRGRFEQDLVGEPFLSLGIHPWNTGDDDIEEQLAWVEDQAVHPRVVALGECGLDRLRGASLSRQERLFERQMVMAERLRKPLIIHCVRAFNEMIRLKREHRIAVPMIVHGFNHREQIGVQLIGEGFWLSFGAALLRPDSAAARMLGTIPEDCFFLETDDANVSIDQVYAAAASLRDGQVSALRDSIWRNFRRLFLHE